MNGNDLISYDHPLYQQAKKAAHEYHDAKLNGASPEEIEQRLTFCDAQQKKWTDSQCCSQAEPAH